MLENEKEITGYSKKKCVGFWLKLNSRQHIGAKEFKDINWLPTPQKE